MAYRYRNRGVLPPPPSTDTTIVFPFLEDGANFDISLYAPIMSQFKVPKEEVEAFFQRLKEAANGYKHLAKPGRKICCFLFVFFVFVIGFVYSVVLMATSSTNNNNYHPSRFQAGLFGMFFFLVFYIVGLICFVVREQKTIKRLRDKMEVVVNQANAYYNTVGLRWRLPPNHFRWIELWLDYRIAQYGGFGMGQNINTNINPGYQPPNYYPQQQQQGYGMTYNNNAYIPTTTV